jgi:hypothetical protein
MPPGARSVLAQAKPETVAQFPDLYDTAVEVHWFGDHRGEDLNVSKSKPGSKGFADSRLLRTKAKADRYLSVTAQALFWYTLGRLAEDRRRPPEDERRLADSSGRARDDFTLRGQA